VSTTGLTFYLAGRYSRRGELCIYKADLEARGHRVSARWLKGEHQVHGVCAARLVEADGPVPVGEAVLFAEDDVEDRLASDVLVTFTEEPRSRASRGGRHVEYGIALGGRRGGGDNHRIYVVGPLENVFYALPEIDGRFDDWGGFLAFCDTGLVEIVRQSDEDGEKSPRDNIHTAVDGEDEMVHESDDPRFGIQRPSLIAALREAIATTGLQLFYQPTVAIDSGRVVGVEALCRWTHPLYGQISPDQFIPVAEASGLIAPLTRWVIDTALAQARRWRSYGFELDVAVNLSPQQMGDPEVVAQVTELLARYELPGSSLVLEITESSTPASRPRDSTGVLDALGALGVHFSLDDFGVGSSSLARLKHLPVSQLKIDKSFTENLTTDPRDHAIVASTIALAHQLGLGVTAEGVETTETFEELASLGCDVAQGYLVSEPLDASGLIRWIRHRGWPSELPGDRCPTCLRPSEVRGRYQSADLRAGETAGVSGGPPVEGHP